MMRLRLAAVGKIKEKYIKEGLQEYEKRLGAYARFETIEVAEEKVPDNPSFNETEAIKGKEGSRLLAATAGKDIVAVALDPQGEAWSSEDLAARIHEWGLYGQSQVVFYIGGTLGLSGEVLAACRYRWSLSRMTFPHQMARLIVLEQIYRAFKIIRGETYHR